MRCIQGGMLGMAKGSHQEAYAAHLGPASGARRCAVPSLVISAALGFVEVDCIQHFGIQHVNVSVLVHQHLEAGQMLLCS